MNTKYFKLLIVILLTVPISAYINSYQTYGSIQKEYEIDNKISKLWKVAKPSIESSIKTVKKSPIELYFIGAETYNLLNYAFYKKDYLLVDELLQLYLKTVPFIKKRKSCYIYDLNEKEEKSKKELKEPIYIWENSAETEELIPTAQFLFVISFAFNKISHLPKAKQTIVMNQFIYKFSPILSSHYKRWMLGVEERDKKGKVGFFSRRGWGCKDKKDNYIYARTLTTSIKELGENNYHGASYCNVIADPSLLIISGLGYYLGGIYNQGSNYTISNQDSLIIAFKQSIKEISKKFSIRTRKNSKNKEIKLLSFQYGAWFGHPDYDYSGYTEQRFPDKYNKNAIKNIGVDTAHGTRILYLLEMLLNNKQYFDISFPTQTDMQMFTNNFLYNIFNRDFNKPLFKNYIDGSNGWFRVNYDSREGYGYAPFQIGSSGAMLGGYAKLAKYNREVEKIFSMLVDKLNSKSKQNQDFIKEFYQNAIWMNYQPREVYHFYSKKVDAKTALYLISFYASLN